MQAQQGLTGLSSAAGQRGRAMGSLWQVHDSMRLAITDLWQSNSPAYASLLRTALLKLTRAPLSPVLAASLWLLSESGMQAAGRFCSCFKSWQKI